MYVCKVCECGVHVCMCIRSVGRCMSMCVSYICEFVCIDVHQVFGICGGEVGVGVDRIECWEKESRVRKTP